MKVKKILFSSNTKEDVAKFVLEEVLFHLSNQVKDFGNVRGKIVIITHEEDRLTKRTKKLNWVPSKNGVPKK